jgi:hypothetical protein
MTRPRVPHLLSLLGAAGLLVAGAACGNGSSGSGASCDGAKCDDLDKPDSEIPDSPCDGKIEDESGRGHEKIAGRLHDPLATHVLQKVSPCPTTFQDLMTALKTQDDCRDSLQSRAISETAQAMGMATSYRLVTSCGVTSGEEDAQVHFSLFGVRAGATALPRNVEIIAFDATTGVFNYYETDGNKIQFFGNSKDMLKGKGAGEVRRCATCHTGGGLVMKELDTPWLHWEGHMETPGADALVEAHRDLLGFKSDGAELEFTVKDGNSKWNRTRLEFLRSLGDTRKILEPLFCSVEVNLDNGADFESPVAGGRGGDEIREIPFDVLLDPAINNDFGGIAIEFSDYDAQIKANGQKLGGVPGAVDTVFDLVFPERAHADMDYVDKLIDAGILDQELARDILAVDFTRPIFSDDRCGLLDKVPSIPASELTAATLRQALELAVADAAPGTPAGDLKHNLSTDRGHGKRVRQFIAACRARSSSEFLADALRFISLLRDQARALPVMEFPQTMPDDDLTVAAGSRLDPATCELTEGFVSAPIEGSEPLVCDPDGGGGGACFGFDFDPDSKGVCIDTGTDSCDGGDVFSGLCPGPSAVRCCIKPE